MPIQLDPNKTVKVDCGDLQGTLQTSADGMSLYGTIPPVGNIVLTWDPAYSWYSNPGPPPVVLIFEADQTMGCLINGQYQQGSWAYC